MKKLLVFLLIVNCIASVAQQLEPFKKGERVVFVGNSITDGGHYHSYIWLYYMTHFPNERIAVFNAGIGGDVAEQILNRLDEDVFAKNPTTITLTFGMNDVGYHDFYKADAAKLADEKITKSYNDFLKIEKKLQDLKGVKKILISSSPYDETAKFKKEVFPGKHAAMLRIVDFQRKSAEINKWGFVDFNTTMMEINQREQKKDSSYTLCGEDRIHPSNDGHLVMAYTFLKTQGLAGKKVADVCIDAAKKNVTRNENCSISNLKVTNNGLSYKYLANSLPFPIDTVPRGWNEKKKQSEALKVIPFMEEFNQELLTLKGLNSGKYALSIDNENVGTFSSDDLEKGINMAQLERTPQYQQALQIMILNEERWEIERRFRQYAWMQFNILKPRGMLFADNHAAIDTINANLSKNIFLSWNKENYSKSRYKEVRELWQNEMDLIIDRIYAINKPKEHIVEIKRIEN